MPAVEDREDRLHDSSQIVEREVVVDDDLPPDLGVRACQCETKRNEVAQS